MDNARLIQLCSCGDKEAIEALYRRFGPSLMRIIRRYVGNDSRAQDILHDTFVIVLTRIEEVRNPSRLNLWMATIARNLCIKYLSEIDLLEILDEQADIPETPPMDELLPYSEIEAIISRLPEGYRRIFRLAVLEGHSHKEIGRMLGISPRTSESQLYHARQLLQRMIMERKRELGIIALLLVAGCLWVITHQSRLADYHESLTSHIAEPKSTMIHETAGETADTVVMPAATVAGISTGSLADASRAESRPDSEAAVQTPDATSGNAYDTADVKENPAESQNQETQAKGEEPRHETDTTTATDRYKGLFTSPVGRGDSKPGTGGGIHARRYARWAVGVHYGVGASASLSGSGDTFSADPSLPVPTPEDSVKTESKIPSNTPVAAEAKREAVISSVDHDLPITIGMNINREITPGLSVESGLTFTLLRSRISYFSSGDEAESRVRNTFIGVPLKLNYTLFRRSSFSGYVTAGAAVDIPLHSHISTNAQGLSLPKLSTRVQFSALGGMGLQYSINRHLGLYFEPSIRYYFNNHSSMPTYWQEHKWAVSLPIGLRLTL